MPGLLGATRSAARGPEAPAERNRAGYGLGGLQDTGHTSVSVNLQQILWLPFNKAGERLGNSLPWKEGAQNLKPPASSALCWAPRVDRIRRSGNSEVAQGAVIEHDEEGVPGSPAGTLVKNCVSNLCLDCSFDGC